MIALDSKQLIQHYIASLANRDATQCAEFFADDAVLHFMMGVYSGKQAIANWHQERFDADMSVLKVDKVVERGSETSCELVIESKRLKAWRINTLRGKAAFRFDNGKIKEVTFSLAGGNPLEGWQ